MVSKALRSMGKALLTAGAVSLAVYSWKKKQDRKARISQVSGMMDAVYDDEVNGELIPFLSELRDSLNDVSDDSNEELTEFKFDQSVSSAIGLASISFVDSRPSSVEIDEGPTTRQDMLVFLKFSIAVLAYLGRKTNENFTAQAERSGMNSDEYSGDTVNVFRFLFSEAFRYNKLYKAMLPSIYANQGLVTNVDNLMSWIDSFYNLQSADEKASGLFDDEGKEDGNN